MNGSVQINIQFIGLAFIWSIQVVSKAYFVDVIVNFLFRQDFTADNSLNGKLLLISTENHSASNNVLANQEGPLITPRKVLQTFGKLVDVSVGEIDRFLSSFYRILNLTLASQKARERTFTNKRRFNRCGCMERNGFACWKQLSGNLLTSGSQVEHTRRHCFPERGLE